MIRRPRVEKQLECDTNHLYFSPHSRLNDRAQAKVKMHQSYEVKGNLRRKRDDVIQVIFRVLE